MLPAGVMIDSWESPRNLLSSHDSSLEVDTMRVNHEMCPSKHSSQQTRISASKFRLLTRRRRSSTLAPSQIPLTARDSSMSTCRLRRTSPLGINNTCGSASIRSISLTNQEGRIRSKPDSIAWQDCHVACQLLGKCTEWAHPAFSKVCVLNLFVTIAAT